MLLVLINQYIAADNGDVFATQLSEQLSTKELSLLQFVGQLGPTITSDHTQTRVKAVQLLTTVLNNLKTSGPPPLVISKQDVSVLGDFLLMKFDDKSCLDQAMAGLAILAQFPQFVASLACPKIIEAIKSKYDPRSHLARVRYHAFALLQSLLTHCQTYFGKHDAAVAFTKLFLAVAEGEKDPRNLLVSFKLNQDINQSFTFDLVSDVDRVLVNDLFDVCFCYFPISFTPPPNDPYKITAGLLKLALSNTIASQSLFAGEAFLLLVEKLTSTNPVIRNDVLLTMLGCAKAYTGDAMTESWLQLWNSLKFELLHRIDNLDAVFKSTEWIIVPDHFEEVVANDDPNKLLFYAAMILGLTFEKIQGEAKSQFLETVLTDLTPMMEKITEKTKAAVVILVQLQLSDPTIGEEVVQYILQRWGKYFGVENAGDQEVLDVHRQATLVDLLGFVLMLSPSSVLVPLKPYILVYLQLVEASQNKPKVVRQLLRMVQLPQLVNTTETKLIFDIVNSQIGPEIIGSLAEVGQKKPELVIEHTLPVLLAQLEAADNEEDQTKLLELVGGVCTCLQILEVLLVRFSSLVKRIASKGFQQLVMECLIEAFTRIEESSQFLTQWSWHEKMAPAFISIATTPMLAENVGDLVGLFVKFTPKTKHDDVLMFYSPNFDVQSPTPEILVWLKVLANLDKLVKYDMDVISILKAIDTVEDPYVNYVYCQLLALGSNKFSTEVSPSVEELAQYTWNLKGKLLKLDSDAVDEFQKYIVASNPAALAVLFEDMPIFSRLVPSIKPKDLVSQVTNLNVRPLAKQRMFEIALPELLSETDDISLAKLAAVMDRVAPEMVKPHLEKLAPAVITSIAMDDDNLQKSGISILNILLDNITVVEPHFSSIIPRLTQLATTNSSAIIRLEAINTLSVIFKNSDKVVAFVEPTLTSMELALDDKKRKVRKAAADLRQVLFEI